MALTLRKEKVEYEVPDFRKEVRAGARLLDKEQPNWWKKIKPRSLRLDDGDTCILGQVFVGGLRRGGWDNGFEKGVDVLLGGDLEKVVRYGFTLGDDVIAWTEEQASGHYLAKDPIDLQHVVWERLAQQWLAEVRVRKEAEKSRKQDAANVAIPEQETAGV